MRRAALILTLCALAASPAAAQFPPVRLKNVKVLPSDISVDALIDTMAGFTRALGVRCNYCHVARDGAPLDSFDFAADTKVTKAKAREMLRMVAAINRDHLSKILPRREPRMVVSCATCHHGVVEPRPIQQLLLNAYDESGADSTEALYRALRLRYYGSAAYDFGEVPLADVAETLQRRARLADAVRFYRLNTEFSPRSGFAFRQAAHGELAAGDTAAAVASLERALAINANDRQAQAALAELRRKP